MEKNFKIILPYEDYSLHALVDREGRVVGVGSIRQIRKRLVTMFGPGSAAEFLAKLRDRGWRLATPQPVLKVNGKVYNACMDKVKAKLKDIPKSPGVYEFLSQAGEVLYVGKAKNLRNRIGQYVSGKDERPQLPYLMAEIADVRYTVVTNELESLFLENTLIKKYYPKYNIQLRDDKNYAFITIDYSCQIPQISYARKFDPENKRVKYFGPYSAAWKIRNTLNLVRRIFPYCAATSVGDRPCFYYYLHRCPGVCVGKISLQEYSLQLDRICWFLSGNTGKVRQELKNEMKIAAGQQQFEKAARLRDQLQAVELLEEKQNVIMPKPVSWDVIATTNEAGFACINLFKIREGKMVDKENFVFETPENSSPGLSASETLQTFAEQYYLETNDPAKVIYLGAPIEDPELIEHIIHSRFNRKALITNPQKGKPVELIKLGQTNAEEHLKNWLRDKAGHLDKINQALAGLTEILKLDKTPERIECYDISNIQGTNAVGSMVVFEKGLPKKSEYRKFRIHTKSTPDDFAMMKEMLVRRVARMKDQEPGVTDKTHWAMPDLIVIDGGKGQLSAALEVLQKFRNSKFEIRIIGLAKRIEEIFVPGQQDPVVLPHDNPSLQLLQRLRDEAHRFGITFHRKLRSKQAVKSALDDIPGVGPKTKKLLKKKFGTVANIRRAKFDDLAAAVGEKIARVIQQSL